ncbi:MAG TPA: ferredoxin-type protein NapG [Azospirillum sp.]|nr:ferredoxin-type protein NapG [Azospirillum sp.]
MASDKPAVDRRRFLADAARGACGAGFLALLLGWAAAPSRTLAANALRPPGALPEADFLSACVRCGLCVRDCPYGTLKLADLGAAATAGTPYFEARTVPCEMCEDIPCVVACPTGALDKGLKDIAKARMGSAVLVGQETCLNVLGLRCDVCYRVCPLIDKAIKLEVRHNERTGRHAHLIPVVNTDACTGCGKCEQSCVLEEAAIKVLPTALAKGRIGGHYQLGWEEKAKRGDKPFVEGIIDLPDRGYSPPELPRAPGKEFRP